MRVNYVIVFVSDMDRSAAFYRDVIGLQLKFESPEWTEFATDGATLALHMSHERAEDDTDADAQTGGGKAAYAHAVGRGFDEVAESLRLRGASTLLNHPDHLAVALRHWRVGGARQKNDHRHR